MLKKVLLFIFLSLFTFVGSPVLAVDEVPAVKQEFATSYDVVYDIDNTGVTTITERINLRNLTSESYASQFKLLISASQIYDIKASDGGGAMQVQSQQKGNSTEINVKFNQQVAGLNKVLSWTLQFKSKDFAEKTGKVWEVRAPKISSVNNLGDYNLTLAVPLEFGEPTIISPTPKSQTTSGGKIFLTFDKNDLQESGVSASFGNQQVFDFDLSYHLKNNNLVPILTSIALPPDTAYQDVIFNRIVPAPLNVTVDDDGNYLAWYRLKRAEKIDIKVVGSAKLYSSSKVRNPKLDKTLREKYTQPDKYWEKDHPLISTKLSEILGKNPPSDNSEKAKLIYRYVVNYLKYDQSRFENNIERLGALGALNNPTQAVCMEFTDLFVALSRAAGIPTRELDGFAYTSNTTLRPQLTNQDILHAWPEYWDEKKGWVMIDPTWESTTGGVDYFNKLDLNHFVLATKGFSSSSPIPAGSYRGSLPANSQTENKDVKVTLSEHDFLGTSKIDVRVENSTPIYAGFPEKIKVKVTNVGNASYPSHDFVITAQKLSILKGDSQKLGSIPAYGTATFEFDVRTKTLFDSFSDQITVLVGAEKFTKDITVKPFFVFQAFPFVAIGIVLAMVGLYGLVLGGLLYRRKLKKVTKSSKK